MIPYLILGLVAGLNAIIIIWKFRAKRVLDGIIDAGVMAIMTSMSGATLGGMIIMLPASLTISMYLFFKPPRFNISNILSNSTK